MGISEKIAYLKGLMEGMNVDTESNEGKLFAAVCAPGAEHKVYGGHELVNLKCDPDRAEALRLTNPEILPGFYMDKRNWIACLLDGALPEETLGQLCKESHRLVLETLPKYVQRDILSTSTERMIS